MARGLCILVRLQPDQRVPSVLECPIAPFTGCCVSPPSAFRAKYMVKNAPTHDEYQVRLRQFVLLHPPPPRRLLRIDFTTRTHEERSHILLALLARYDVLTKSIAAAKTTESTAAVPSSQPPPPPMSSSSSTARLAEDRASPQEEANFPAAAAAAAASEQSGSCVALRADETMERATDTGAAHEKIGTSSPPPQKEEGKLGGAQGREQGGLQPQHRQQEQEQEQIQEPEEIPSSEQEQQPQGRRRQQPLRERSGSPKRRHSSGHEHEFDDVDAMVQSTSAEAGGAVVAAGVGAAGGVGSGEGEIEAWKEARKRCEETFSELMADERTRCSTTNQVWGLKLLSQRLCIHFFCEDIRSGHNSKIIWRLGRRTYCNDL